MKDRLDLLIEIISDETAREDEKDDAIIIIEDYNNDRALNALVKVASNSNENKAILESCGESIGRMWIRQNSFNPQLYAQIDNSAKFGAYINIRAKKPEWLPLLNKIGPNWSN